MKTIKRWHYALVGHNEKGAALYARCGERGGFEQPWVSQRVAQQDAKRHGAVAVFHRQLTAVQSQATAYVHVMLDAGRA